MVCVPLTMVAQIRHQEVRTMKSHFMEICGSVLLFHQRGHTTIHPRPKFTTSFSGSCLSSFLFADQVDSSFDPRRPPASRCSPLRPDSNLLYVVCGHFLDCHRNLVRRFWNPYPFYFSSAIKRIVFFFQRSIVFDTKC